MVCCTGVMSVNDGVEYPQTSGLNTVNDNLRDIHSVITKIYLLR